MTKVFHHFFKNLYSGCFSMRLAATDMETKSGTTSSSKASQTIFLYVYFLFPWKWKDTGKMIRTISSFFPISNCRAIQSLGEGGSGKQPLKGTRRNEYGVIFQQKTDLGYKKQLLNQFPRREIEGILNLWIATLQQMHDRLHSLLICWYSARPSELFTY